MFTRLREPGGLLGGLSVAATLIFAILGIVGFVSMLTAAATDSDMWSDQGDRVLGSVVFGLMLAGAVGFFVMDRQPLLGAFLAVLGCIGLAITLRWTIVPVLLGIAFGVVAVKRAQVFQERALHA
jgi:hypothetical protein